MLSTFYITFSTLAVPGVMLTRKIGPRWTIPGYMIGWGAMAMLNTACRTFAGVLVVRLRRSHPVEARGRGGLDWRNADSMSYTCYLVLGAFEAGFAASLIFYLTTFYTRGELGARIAIFYSCQALAGAFSGYVTRATSPSSSPNQLDLAMSFSGADDINSPGSSHTASSRWTRG